MRAVKQGLLIALVAMTNAAANAGTVHHVRFVQPAQILVWEHGELIAHGAHIQLNEGVSAPANLLGAGTLVAANTDATNQKIISVASNTAFSVKSSDARAGDAVSVRVLGVRANAQARAEREAGSLFRQAAKTAAHPGIPTSQAIELEISWIGDTRPNLFIVAD